jgi:hypothetical protein
MNTNWRRLFIVLLAIALMTYMGVRNSPDSIYNPDNQPYVLECAADLGIDANDVTQLQFNERYLK